MSKLKYLKFYNNLYSDQFWSNCLFYNNYNIFNFNSDQTVNFIIKNIKLCQSAPKLKIMANNKFKNLNLMKIYQNSPKFKLWL